jgi:hypothetical protein
MNDALGQYGQFIGTLAAQVIIGVFIYGQLTQRVKDLTGWMKRHDSNIEKHQEILINHEGRISHVEGCKGVPLGAKK